MASRIAFLNSRVKFNNSRIEYVILNNIISYARRVEGGVSMKYTIIADSSCDLKMGDINSSKLSFATVPLSIIINGKEVIDEETLDTKELVKAMKTNQSKPMTSCPSPDAFAEEMRKGNDNIFCITISSKISGTFNSASLAAGIVKSEDPKKNIFVLDSLSASGGIAIIIYELVKLIESEKYTFEEITAKISEIRSNTRVRFQLQDFGNLIKTGRMSKVKAIIASLLNLKVICGDNGDGEIKQCANALGTKKTLGIMSDFLKDKMEAKDINLPVGISHCHNEEDAGYLKSLIESKFGLKNIKIFCMRGLATFYANEKGLLLAY